jgi:RNA polymerase sigma-70 factor (subfamily 1)
MTLQDDAFSQTTRQVQAARSGDKEALNHLLARYLPWVRQTVALRLGRPLRECADLEDIVQESLIDAFRALDQLAVGSEGRFRHWMAQIVLNNVRDQQRRNRSQMRDTARACRLDSRPASRATIDPPARDATPSEVAQANELEESVEQAMLGLTATHREVIVLRDRCGMDYAEIAEQLGFKNGDTARALYNRALARLRAVLR